MPLICLLLVGSLLIYFFTERRTSDTEQPSAAGICPECREPVSPNQTNCPKCQASLWGECSHCGQPIQKSWSLCPNCGTALNAPLKRGEQP